MTDEVTDYMPPAPKGHAFRVFAPEWYQRDFVPRWLRPLTVYIYEDSSYYLRFGGEPPYYSMLSHQATARNNPASIRRAALRAIDRFYAEERKKEAARIHAATAQGRAEAEKQRAKADRESAERQSKKAQRDAQFAAYVGNYPPKKLTDRK